VNLEFVESWLQELDQDSYEQVVAALELLEELRSPAGSSAGRQGKDFTAQEHEGVATWLQGSIRVTNSLRF